MCCGSAGVYNLLSPGPAGELGARKAAAVRASGADLLAAGNPGCLLQIQAALGRDGGPPLPAVHTIEILDASLSGTPLPLLPELHSGTSAPGCARTASRALRRPMP